mmetsp:Transcript_114240/g.323033  ORF Transcript_114240/g.323033 Transcript_114240/m.323033 type:complete len:493 (-) Transcript_114240:277-1755(-)
MVCMHCPGSGSHVWHALRYAAVVFTHAVLILTLALPCCVVPFALTLRAAGQALVSQRRSPCELGHARLAPIGWTPVDVSTLDDFPFYAFWVFRFLSLLSISIGHICIFVISWRGIRAFFGTPLLVAGTGAIFTFLSFMALIWLPAEGHVETPLAEVLLRVHAYAHVVTWGFLVMISISPQPRRHARRLLTIWVAPILVHGAIAGSRAIYFLSPDLLTRSACMFVLMSARGFGVSLVVSQAGQLPGCPPEAPTFIALSINMLALGAVQIIHSASHDLAGMTLLFVLMAVSEIVRHVLYLNGDTEWSFAKRLVKACLCMLRPTREIQVAVVPDGSLDATPAGVTVKREVATADKAPGAEKREILKGVVAATNVTEIVVVVSVIVVFAIAMLNPLEAGTKPHFETALAAGCLALCSELCSDFATHAVASHLCGIGCNRYCIAEEQRKRIVLTFQNAGLAFTTVMITLDCISGFAVQLCPWPERDSNHLMAIGACS